MIGASGKNKYTGFFICVAVIIFIIAVTQEIFFTFDPIKTLELKTIDNLFQERGELNIADSSDVIILEITDDTYQQIPPPHNSWPWPRSIFAQVIENLNEAGVRAIGIDLMMTSPDKFDPKNDSLLISAIRRYGNVVVSGQIDITREQLIYNVERGNLNKSVGIIRKNNENFSNIFFSADSSIGMVNVPSDYDGVYRRYSPYVFSSIADKYIPTFSFAVLNKYFKKQNNYLSESLPDVFIYNGREIPKQTNSSILINYYSLQKDVDFKHIKLIDVLDDKDFDTIDEIDTEVELNTWDDPDFGILDSGLFKDKIVLIGSTMPEDKDQFPVSISAGTGSQNLMYGVKLHASIIQNVLDQSFISRQGKVFEIIQIIIFTFFAFYLSALVKKLKLKKTYLIEIISILILLTGGYFYYHLSVYLFIEKHYLLIYINPLLAVTLGYFSSTAYNFLKERQQNTIIKGMFGYYVSRELVNELIANPDKLKLGGESRELTILFSDIVGFSTLSEKMSAEELVTLMNEYLSAMTEIVLVNSGTLDKYIGDAVMAFWGAPLNVEDHAFKACKSAILMRNKVDEMQKEWNERGVPPIDIRIGVNTGEVVVGNMGGEKRFDYTVMGDEVNLASRLEGANKQYNSFMMISDTTYEQVKDQVVTRELDTIVVKGKTKPTTTYELIGLADDPKALSRKESLYIYFEALEQYKNKDFNRALELFSKSIAEAGDMTSQIYADRCKFYIENPPDNDWNGVFTMTTK